MFTAEEPAGVGADKYDATAVAMIALLKYGTGVPFHRMERLEGQMGLPLPAATQWELMKPAAGSLEPVLDEFIRQAAQGSVIHNDDTGMRVLKLVRSTDDGRTGTFTSGIVSVWREWRIALYFTGWKHAGENLACKSRKKVTSGRSGATGSTVAAALGLFSTNSQLKPRPWSRRVSKPIEPEVHPELRD